MSDRSSIEWTDATWNPVTGCTKVSPGCKYCYAETFAERFRGVPGHPYEQGFDLRLWPDRLKAPLTWRKPRVIFVNSMSDLFHEEVPDEFIAKVFATMARANHHVYQVLTKRPERMSRLLKSSDLQRHPHIWLGTSVENQDYLWRAETLAGIDAGVRFLSCEPLLGPLDLAAVLPDLEWVIVGVESGPKARPMAPEWARDIRDECVSAGVPFFFKQWGRWGPLESIEDERVIAACREGRRSRDFSTVYSVGKSEAGRVLDGRTWDEMPERVA